MMIKRLDELVPQQNAQIVQVRGFGALRQRMMDMGLVPGAEINVVRVAPMGDPIEYRVKGYHLSLRSHEARHILVEVESVALCHVEQGEVVRVVGFMIGRHAAYHHRMEMNLHVGDTLEILQNGRHGRILAKCEDKLIEIRHGIAHRIMVEIVPKGETK